MPQEPSRQLPSVIVMGWIRLAPADRDRWLNEVREVVRASRLEPEREGMEYTAAADPLDPERIVFVERCPSAEAFLAHLDSEHHRSFHQRVKDIPIIDGPQYVRCFEGTRYEP